MMKMEFQFEDVVAFSKFIMNVSEYYDVQSVMNVIKVGSKQEVPQEENEPTKEEDVKPIEVEVVEEEAQIEEDKHVPTLEGVKVEKAGRGLNIIGMDKVYDYYVNTSASQSEIAKKIKIPQTTLLSKLQIYVKHNKLEKEYQKKVEGKAKPVRGKRTAK